MSFKDNLLAQLQKIRIHYVELENKKDKNIFIFLQDVHYILGVDFK